MNRLKKEEKRKWIEARKGLSADQIEALDRKDEYDKKIDELARKIHVEKFSEEYDFQYDESVDIKARKKGINPMRKEYIDKVNKKRADLGVSPLDASGMPTSNDTMEICIEEAKNIYKLNED